MLLPLEAKLSLVTILSTKITMEQNWSRLRLGMRLFTRLLTSFLTGLLLGFSLILSDWFGLGANLSLCVDCGGTETFPNFPSLSPLLPLDLSNPKAQPSKRLQLAIIIPS
jgi:hypothetical protein